MSEVFDKSSGIVLPLTSEIRTDIATKFQNAFKTNPNDPLLNVDPSAPMGQVVDLLVAEIESKNAEIAYLANMLNIKTARGKFLDSLGALYFLERKVSEPTYVTCECTGLKDTLIPYGVIVQDTSGNKLRLTNMKGITIDESGTATGVFQTIEHGEIEVSAHSVTTIVTAVSGWDSVDNVASGVKGRLEESDSDFLLRIKNSVSINAQGTRESIQSAVNACDGVIDCQVLENITSVDDTIKGVSVGGHSVAVCVYGGNDTDIARAIYQKKSGGCGTSGDTEVTYVATEYGNQEYTYYIVRPTPTNVYINVVFYSDVDTKTKEAIKTEILSDFLGEKDNTRVSLGSTLYASRFITTIFNVTTNPLSRVEVKLGSGSFANYVDINADIEPILTRENITIGSV